jgi:hypothetical protein
MTHILSTHEKRLGLIETLVVTGQGDMLPLPELVRNLTNTVGSYIERKEREEAISKAQWDKFKWIIFTFFLTGGLTFAVQAIVFFVRIFPLLEKLADVP